MPAQAGQPHDSTSDVKLTPQDGRWRWFLNQLWATKTTEKSWLLTTDSKFSAIYHCVASMWHTNGGKGCRQGLATSGATGTDFDRSVSYPYLNQQGQVMSVTLLLAPSPRFTDFFIKKAFVHPWRLKAFFVLFNFFFTSTKSCLKQCLTVVIW